MGLLSFLKLKRQDDARRGPNPGPASADAVQEARTGARRRLIGAAVLVAVGIVGFPLLFETTPRPVPVDIPIEIPSRQGAAPLALPPAKPQAAQGTVADGAASAAARRAPAGAMPVPVITERADDAGREVNTAKPAAAVASTAVAKPAATSASRPVPAKPEAKVEAKAEAKPEAKAASKPEPKPEPKPDPKAVKVEPPKPVTVAPPVAAAPVPAAAAADAGTGRFVVQVGAFGEASSARDARLRVEKLGLKTYTQEVEVDGKKRIRVRVGPFATKAEAEKAVARIKGGGLPAALLTL